MQQLPDDLVRDDAADKAQSTLSEHAAIGIGFAWDLGYMIAVPAVVLGFGGAYLDKTIGTKPLFFILGLLVAFVVSFFHVYRKIKVIINAFPPDLPKKKSDEESHRAEGEKFHEALLSKTKEKSFLEHVIDDTVPPKSDR